MKMYVSPMKSKIQRHLLASIKKVTDDLQKAPGQTGEPLCGLAVVQLSRGCQCADQGGGRPGAGHPQQTPGPEFPQPGHDQDPDPGAEGVAAGGQWGAGCHGPGHWGQGLLCGRRHQSPDRAARRPNAENLLQVLKKCLLSYFQVIAREEYQLDHLVGSLSIPYIAIMNGITMGGGVGISVNGKFRVATESTMFAMPECAIGLVPDVGGGFFLPRLPGQLGMFLGLTGHRLKGWDCFKAGVATHAASEDSVDKIQTELMKLTSSSENVSHEDVKSLLDNFTSVEAKNHTFSLSNQMQDINEIFSANCMEEIVSLLKDEKFDQSLRTKALKSIEAASPTSLKIAFRQIREGARLSSLAEVLKMEQRLVLRCCEDKDFYEVIFFKK